MRAMAVVMPGRGSWEESRSSAVTLRGDGWLFSWRKAWKYRQPPRVEHSAIDSHGDGGYIWMTDHGDCGAFLRGCGRISPSPITPPFVVIPTLPSSSQLPAPNSPAPQLLNSTVYPPRHRNGTRTVPPVRRHDNLPRHLSVRLQHGTSTLLSRRELRSLSLTTLQAELNEPRDAMTCPSASVSASTAVALPGCLPMKSWEFGMLLIRPPLPGSHLIPTIRVVLTYGGENLQVWSLRSLRSVVCSGHLPRPRWGTGTVGEPRW